MPFVAYIVANSKFRKCGKFGTFRVCGFVVRKVTRRYLGTTLPPRSFSLTKGLNSCSAEQRCIYARVVMTIPLISIVKSLCDGNFILTDFISV